MFFTLYLLKLYYIESFHNLSYLEKDIGSIFSDISLHKIFVAAEAALAKEQSSAPERSKI